MIQQQQQINLCPFCDTDQLSKLVEENMEYGFKVYQCLKCEGLTFNDLCKNCMTELASNRMLRIPVCIACDYSLASPAVTHT
jgi:ribosomal protein L37AE/L43A